jgi:hypothetical protein
VTRLEDFKKQQQAFDELPTVADGFLARRDNLAVFSLARTDVASEALEKNTKSLWQQLPRGRDGALKRLPATLLGGAAVQPVQGVVYQTVALLDRALDEDSEIASVTHEGTRQLLAATGQLPRNVEVPQWLQFGWASFFESPKGSPWMTVGAPSATPLEEYNYLLQFKKMQEKNKLEKTQLATLEKVVTDAYFREYAKDPKKEEAGLKARALAWSLTYFLANGKFDGLLRYQEELKKLPRDLEFDHDTLLLTFARAFDCVDVTNPDVVDRTKLARLARQWYDAINLTPAENEEVIKERDRAQAELKANPPKPGNAPAGIPPTGPGGDGR